MVVFFARLKVLQLPRYTKRTEPSEKKEIQCYIVRNRLLCRRAMQSLIHVIVQSCLKTCGLWFHCCLLQTDPYSKFSFLCVFSTFQQLNRLRITDVWFFGKLVMYLHVVLGENDGLKRKDGLERKERNGRIERERKKEKKKIKKKTDWKGKANWRGKE